MNATAGLVFDADADVAEGAGNALFVVLPDPCLSLIMAAIEMGGFM